LEFASEAGRRNPAKIKSPAVVGAVIDLGLCLDLTTSAGIQLVRDTHPQLVKIMKEAGYKPPVNSSDSLRRNLDCAVINLVHKVREKAQGNPKKRLPPIDSVRGIFVEGVPIYAGSGFFNKSHIQICVRNPNCIKGIFRVREDFL